MVQECKGLNQRWRYMSGFYKGMIYGLCILNFVTIVVFSLTSKVYLTDNFQCKITSILNYTCEENKESSYYRSNVLVNSNTSAVVYCVSIDIQCDRCKSTYRIGTTHICYYNTMEIVVDHNSEGLKIIFVVTTVSLLLCLVSLISVTYVVCTKSQTYIQVDSDDD